MSDDSILELRIRVEASPAVLYRYLSDPDRFRAWMGDADIEARPGGVVRVRYPNGHCALGSIIERVPDRRLVFSWGYEGSAELPPATSTVAIELEPEGGATVVVLRHSGLPGGPSRDGHHDGWTHYLSRLAGAVTAERLAEAATRHVDAFMTAWAETEPSRRLTILEAACEAPAVFADRLGSATGCQAISDYIGAAQRFMPGARLVRCGPVELVLDRARFAWEAVAADGRALGRGAHFVELAGSGRLRRLTGFWDQA
ncbi:MAG TPA: SRPBCC family protein [Gemmatimonadaceae bacterium]|nr:SRPBCC family protein [Gemmatimonadaceae bacterium]